MDSDAEDLNMDRLRHFLNEQEKKLKSDKLSLQKKGGLDLQHSIVGSNEEKSGQHDFGTRKNTVPQPKDAQTCSKIMLNDKAPNIAVINSREKEKEKLIKSLSLPKSRHSCPNIRVVNRFETLSKNSLNNSYVDPREKEKDRLAEIFASSGYQFSKTSNIQVCKNLNSRLSFDENKSFDLKNNKFKSDCVEPSFSRNYDNCEAENVIVNTEGSGSNSKKCNIPKILVSEYKENSKPLNTKPITTTSDSAMVRIGEFSPLNPNNPAGKPQLGLGEYEERRKLLMDQRRQEYNQYLQEVSKCHSPTRGHNSHCRDAETQTVWEDEPVDKQMEAIDNQMSPVQCSNSPLQEEERHCRFSPGTVSPVARCFQGFSEKEVKEYLYREELQKQIEEKNRLREEMKRREEEEDAKLEAKVRRDQEEMMKQFEAERLQRLELALRKKEQEDILRQRLAAEQQKALEESKVKKKQLRKDKSLSPRESSSQTSTRNSRLDHRVVPLTQSLPSTVASKALSEGHEVLKQPILEIQGSEETSEQSSHETVVPMRKDDTSEQLVDKTIRSSAILSPPIHKVKEVDMLVQKAAFDPNMQRRVSREESLFSSRQVVDYREQVNRLLKEPLLPESFVVLPPMSPPLLHATVPPFNPSRSPPIAASKRVQRTNSDLLEDKWKVPYVEHYNAAPPDVLTKHNRSVLTQLGAFRRHLQQERLRMQERVQAESP